MSYTQPSLFAGAPAASRRTALEVALAGELAQLSAWNSRPSDAVDWELEALLESVRLLAIELRACRHEEAIPF